MRPRFIVIMMFAIGAATYFLLPPPQPSNAAVPGTITYTYDSLGRLVGETNTSGNSSTFTYDAAGNRITSTRN